MWRWETGEQVQTGCSQPWLYVQNQVHLPSERLCVSATHRKWPRKGFRVFAVGGLHVKAMGACPMGRGQYRSYNILFRSP